MDSRETQAFAERLMREVWEPFAAEAVPRFYHRDMIGHHRKQQLTYGFCGKCWSNPLMMSSIAW